MSIPSEIPAPRRVWTSLQEVHTEIEEAFYAAQERIGSTHEVVGFVDLRREGRWWEEGTEDEQVKILEFTSSYGSESDPARLDTLVQFVKDQATLSVQSTTDTILGVIVVTTDPQITKGPAEADPQYRDNFDIVVILQWFTRVKNN